MTATSSSSPVVSVVIPCHNHGQYLDEAVASVRAQSYPHWEIIIIDDGSTDPDTVAVLDRLGQTESIAVLRTEQNGPAIARNNGIGKARGQYILPLDADDSIGVDYLKQAVAVLESQPETGIVYCHAEYFGARNGPWELSEYSFPGILLDNCIFSSMVYRRADWQRTIGYNPNMTHGWEDYDFVLSLVELGVGIVRLPDVLFYYRITPGSRDHAMTSAMQVDAYAQMYRNHRDLYDSNIESVFREMLDLRRARRHEQVLEEQLDADAQARKEQIKHYRDRITQLEETVSGLQTSGLHAAIQHLRMRRTAPTASSTPVTHQSYEQWWEAYSAGNSEHPPLPVPTGTTSSEPSFALVTYVNGPNYRYLSGLIRSLQDQNYAHWQLGVAIAGVAQDVITQTLPEDGRVHCIAVAEDRAQGAALQAAAESVHGDYLGVLVPELEFASDGLTALAAPVANYGADFVYGDSDEIDQSGRHVNPNFKPDFSPDLLLGVNYIDDSFVLSRRLFNEISGFDLGRSEGARSDLVLRATERASLIFHTRRITHHKRALDKQPDQAQRSGDEVAVLQEAIRRQGVDATLEPLEKGYGFRVRRALPTHPLISIVVPWSPAMPMSTPAAVSILEKTAYSALEFMISSPLQKEEAAAWAATRDVIWCHQPAATHWADLANAAGGQAKGEHLVFLDPRANLVSADWLEPMLEHSLRANIGAVGATIYDEAERIFSAGLYIDPQNVVGHAHHGLPRGAGGYQNRLQLAQNVTGVSGACLMIKRDLFHHVSGFDTRNFATCYHDMDLCLRLLSSGYLNMFTPFSEMAIHSGREGMGASDVDKSCEETETDFFRVRHKEIFGHGDYYFSPALVALRDQLLS